MEENRPNSPPHFEAAFDLVALAASAGGLMALTCCSNRRRPVKDRAIAVVLFGTGSDGAMGVQAIKKMSGTVIVQDEKTAEFFDMPGAAIHTDDTDFILPLDEIAHALIILATQRDLE